MPQRLKERQENRPGVSKDSRPKVGGPRWENLDKRDERTEMMMILPIPLLLQGAEWLIVLVVAVPLVVVGLVIYVIVKLGLAGAGALDRYGKANASPRGYPSSGTAAGFCAACGAPMAPGSKFCPNCGRQV